MNRANQAALYQATNQGLLSIRQSELNYYVNLNVAFGTQAALIGGFIGLPQVPQLLPRYMLF